MRIRFGIPLVLVLVAGCEHGVDVTGEVTVPVSVQQLFSPERPGLVTIEADVPNVGLITQDLAILCAPGTADLVLPVDLFDFGCVAPGTTTVTVRAQPAAEGSTLACDGLREPNPPLGTALATATGTFDTRVLTRFGDLGDCRDGAVAVDLVLAQP